MIDIYNQKYYNQLDFFMQDIHDEIDIFMIDKILIIHHCDELSIY